MFVEEMPNAVAAREKKGGSERGKEEGNARRNKSKR